MASSVTLVIAKVTLYICITIISCMWISKCDLSENIVEVCEDSCKGYSSHMESVTSRECKCIDSKTSIGTRSDSWVIPKK